MNRNLIIELLSFPHPWFIHTQVVRTITSSSPEHLLRSSSSFCVKINRPTDLSLIGGRGSEDASSEWGIKRAKRGKPLTTLWEKEKPTRTVESLRLRAIEGKNSLFPLFTFILGRCEARPFLSSPAVVMGLGISRYMEGAGPGRARRRRYRIRLSSNRSFIWKKRRQICLLTVKFQSRF